MQVGIIWPPFGITTLNTTVLSPFPMEGDAACTLQEPSDLESLRVNKEEVCCWPRTNWTRGLCQAGQNPVSQQKEQKSEVISRKRKKEKNLRSKNQKVRMQEKWDRVPSLGQRKGEPWDRKARGVGGTEITGSTWLTWEVEEIWRKEEDIKRPR